MLIQFTVENFLSFAERVTFSMLPGKGRLHANHVVKTTEKDIATLKTAVIYGANASGKSNLIKAIKFAKKLILIGSNNEKEGIGINVFRLDTTIASLDSRFEFEIKCQGKFYAFGFVCDNRSYKEEWLFEITKNGEKEIYTRKLEGDQYKFSHKGIEGKDLNEVQFLEFTQKGTRKNQLFITECKVRNVQPNVSDVSPVFDVIKWFDDVLQIITPDSPPETTVAEESFTNTEVKEAFHRFLTYFGTGIAGVDFEEIPIDKIPHLPQNLLNKVREVFPDDSNASIRLTNPNGIKYTIGKTLDGEFKASTMVTLHKHRNCENIEQFQLLEESDGSKRIIDFIPIMMELFDGNAVILIDEIDRSLHPNLTYDFIDIFLSNTIGLNSQLIVTTHESRLLSQKLLRKDEIWFMIKEDGATSNLYSLNDFNVRFDKEIRKDYLLGRFNGVPKFGNRNQITALRKINAKGN